MTGGAATVELGDCVSVLARIEAGTVDAVVTDPPYGLEFMGVDWDRLGGSDLDQPDEPRFGRSGGGRGMQRWHERWASEALRVLKPGAHLLAFGGTRTYHRLAAALEEAGFEIRDCLAWLYGQGFPKSLDVSKAIDRSDVRRIRRERELRFTAWLRGTGLTASRLNELTGSCMGGHYLTQAAQPQVPTPEHWALIRPHVPGEIPAWVDRLVHDRAVVSETWRARPVTGRHDRYGLQDWRARYDGRGRALAPRERRDVAATEAARRWHGFGTALKPAFEPIVLARKPLQGTVAENVLAYATGALNIDGCRIAGPKADGNWAGSCGERPAGVYAGGWAEQRTERDALGRWPANVVLDEQAAALLDAQSGRRGDGDAGGAARFFYCAKAGRSEREAGLEALPPLRFAQSGSGRRDAAGDRKRYGDSLGLNRVKAVRNTHPTVKPVALMRWLVRLVTPPGGLVLDPFAGSGTTGIACLLEGFRFLGVEREPAYVAIARARIAHWAGQAEVQPEAAAA